MHSIKHFFETMQQSRVAFIGTGVTNGDIIRLFRKKNIDVTLLDRKTPEKLGKVYEEFQALGVKFCLGDSYLDTLTDYDVVFRSPGMYYHNEKLQEARKKGVVITSEMEAFFALCPCKIYAVTGSDGKTTTTTLISEFLAHAGFRVHKGGNIGRALLPIIEDIREEDVAVVELSSFQLLSMRQSPDVAVITNIAPNHLDVHGTMEEYIYAKTNILAHQDAFSRTILNLDNEPTMNLASMVRGTLTTFSRRQKPEFGTYLREDGMLCFTKDGVDTPVVQKDDIRIPGMHNVENYLAAIAAVQGMVPDDVILHTAETFPGVEHRIELVRTLNGVRYYNDSIASSPTRTIAGLHSFHQKVILIAGGYDKKIPFEVLGKEVQDHVKTLVLTGHTAEKIQKAVVESEGYQAGHPSILMEPDFKQAVLKASKAAEEGDVVILSPACASFDHFKNFAQRGQIFKAIVNEL